MFEKNTRWRRQACFDHIFAVKDQKAQINLQQKKKHFCTAVKTVSRLSTIFHVVCRWMSHFLCKIRWKSKKVLQGYKNVRKFLLFFPNTMEPCQAFLEFSTRSHRMVQLLADTTFIDLPDRRNGCPESGSWPLYPVRMVVGLHPKWARKITNKKPINWWGRQNAAPLKFDLKPLEAAFSAVFRTSINADWK